MISTPRIRATTAASLLFVLTFLIAGAHVHANEDPPVQSAEPNESAALAFVHANHPELQPLLKQLADRNPAEYRKAIADLDAVSRRLADQQPRDPQRHALMLESWKAGSRTRLLAARLRTAKSPPASLERELRTLIELQLDAESALQTYDLQLARQRVERLETQLKKSRQNRPGLIETRFRNLTRKAGPAPSVTGARPRATARPINKAARPASPPPSTADPKEASP